MSDGLQIPEVPEPKPEDPEDVSWALSTAEAMWARGDHSEGIKWVRRAAEAASEAENDERALELAKIAAELAGMIARPASPVSRASIDLEEVVEEPPAAPPPVPSRPSAAPPKAVSKPPAAAPAKPIGTSSTKQAGPQSQRPPAPLPSQTSQGAQASQSSQASPTSSVRGTASAPRPVGTGAAGPTTPRPKIPPSSPSKPPPSVRGSAKRSRKSRENLDSEARAARGINDTSKNAALDSTTSVIEAPPAAPSSDTLLGNNDPTVIGNLSDILKNQEGGSPESGDRQTVVGSPRDLTATILKRPEKLADKLVARGLQVPAASTNGGLGASKSPATLLERTSPSGIPAARTSVNPPARIPNEQHDPRIVTSQAVRVVVWRDANGIHVAPAGTVVSAITVDAVLVALEPNADLTAWLGARDRT